MSDPDPGALLPEPRLRRRIRLVFALVVLSVPVAEAMRRAGLEPVPALLAPTFSAPEGTLLEVTLRAGFADGTVIDLDPAAVWPEIDRVRRAKLLNRLYLILDTSPRGTRGSFAERWPWRTLLPGLEVRQRRRRSGADLDPALRLWFRDRLARIHPRSRGVWLEISGRARRIERPRSEPGRIRLDL